MGIHPIRCGSMFPLRIALTLGQVAHTTMGRTFRGRWGLWPFWAVRPKFTQTWSLEKSYLRITRKIGLGFCMDANRIFASLLQKGLGFKASWKHF